MWRAARPALAGACALALLISAPCGGDDAGPQLIVFEGHDQKAANVYTIDPYTGEVKQLTDGDGFDGNATWSPDRSRIVFTSDRDAPTPDVYTMDADGGDLRRLTETPDTEESSPRYSPDGGRIALAGEIGGEWFIQLMEADGTGQHSIAGPYRFAEFPEWADDGRTVYFAAIGEGTQAADIFSVDVETRETRMVISTPGSDVCVHLLPDGKSFTYASTHGIEGREPDIYEHELASTDTTGASDRRLTEHEARDDYAEPSRDGEHFVFISRRDGNFDLYVMDRDGSDVRRITDTPELRENVPDW